MKKTNVATLVQFKLCLRLTDIEELVLKRKWNVSREIKNSKLSFNLKKMFKFAVDSGMQLFCKIVKERTTH